MRLANHAGVASSSASAAMGLRGFCNWSRTKRLGISVTAHEPETLRARSNNCCAATRRAQTLLDTHPTLAHLANRV